MNQNINKDIDRSILLNPGPATTSELLKSSLIVSDICPREKEFGSLVQNVRSNALKIVNANSLAYTTVLIGGSGTAAVESALLTVERVSKKKLLIIENGAYGKRIKEIASVYQMDFDSLDYAWGDLIDLVAVERALARNDYGCIAWIHHETTTGMLNPFNEIISLAEKFGVYTLCDAMSSYGCLEIDLEQGACDLLVSSSNKGVHGFAGVGIVISSLALLEKCKGTACKSYYLDMFKHYEQFNKDGQFPFTPPVQILYALNIALEETLKVGVSTRQKHYFDLHQILINGMQELGFSCLLPLEQHSKVLTAFIEPDNFDFNAYHDYLFAKGITVYPGKGAKESTFRIANMGELSQEDILFFLKQTENYLKQ